MTSGTQQKIVSKMSDDDWMQTRYRIFKGRPEWRATVPERPWTVLYWDQTTWAYGTIGVHSSWDLAWRQAVQDAYDNTLQEAYGRGFRQGVTFQKARQSESDRKS